MQTAIKENKLRIRKMLQRKEIEIRKQKQKERNINIAIIILGILITMIIILIYNNIGQLGREHCMERGYSRNYCEKHM